MSLRIHNFYNNSGGLNLHSNIHGLNDTEAEEIINLHLTGRGSWSSRNIGYTVITGSALNNGTQITGFYHYVENTGTEHTVIASGSKVYELNIGAGTGNELGNGFTSDARMNFTTFQNKLILCNGKESPKKWVGSGSLVDLAGWPPVISGISPGNPSLSEVFANRLIFSGDADNPSIIYISALENPENFTPSTGATSAGAIQVSPGDGQRITALKTLYLPLDNQEVLVIFKEHSTFLLAGHDADTFTLQKINGSVGAASHKSAIVLGGDLMFLSEQGVSTLSTTTLQGNIAAGSISQNVSAQIASLNQYALSKSFAVHIPYRQEIWWFVPEGSSSQNQLILIYNYSIGSGVWSKRQGITASCGVIVNKRLYTGTYNGHVHRQLEGNSYAGAPITWQYKTPCYTLGQPRLNKRIREIEISLTQLANTSFTVKSAWNNAKSEKHKQSQTISVLLDNQSTLYGYATYGSDIYDAAGIFRSRLMINGSGQSLQLEFTGTQTVSPVELQGWAITTIEGGF